MSSPVLAAAGALREALAGFEPGQFSGADCARLGEELALTAKACATAGLLAAAGATRAGAHREAGFKDPASWLARQSGTTATRAREALETARRLEECPDTKEALRAGEISLSQAHEITKTESETPGAEAELLKLARRSDLSQVRDRARQHRQAQVDPAALRRRQLGLREFRHWRDRDGMIGATFALPPESGLALVGRVEAAALRRRRAAGDGGQEPERFEAHAADALAQLVAGATNNVEGPRPHSTELVLVCDLYAWRRGHSHPGELCHIIGGGPLPPEVAKDLAQDAFVKVALHDGTNIHTVKYFGRHLPAALRTALDLGPVPEFTGRACVDCGSRWGLEYDHVDPVANGGPTEYANLQARCYKDHQLKTEQDRKAGLLGPKPS
jgi:HNH endonuclease